MSQHSLFGVCMLRSSAIVYYDFQSFADVAESNSTHMILCMYLGHVTDNKSLAETRQATQTGHVSIDTCRY